MSSARSPSARSSHLRVLIRDHQRGAGRTHSATTPVTVGSIQDHMVGFDDRHFESLIDGEIRSECAEETLPDGLRGQLAGYLTAGRPAQAVGDHQQVAAVPFVTDVNHRVLIFPPLPSCVSAMSYDDLMFHGLFSLSRL